MILEVAFIKLYNEVLPASIVTLASTNALAGFGKEDPNIKLPELVNVATLDPLVKIDK